MSNVLFSSSLAQYLSDYLALRRSLGYEIRTCLFVLRQFDRVVPKESQSSGPVSRNLIEEYLRSLAHLQPITRRLRLSIIRQFLLYLRRFEPTTFIPDRSMEPARSTFRAPYIFTEDEICKLIRAAYDYPARYRCRRWFLYPTLFGLLYVTGMRVSEALQLTLEDLDLREGILRIYKTKFHKARLIPLAESTCAALKRYLRARAERSHPTAAGAYLFVNDRGTRLPYTNVRNAFHFVVRMAGIERKTRCPIPRIHDLRHTAAVRRLYLWYHEGKNVQALLPVLSTFLGHSKVSGTAIYLTTTAELSAEATLRFKKHLSDAASKKGRV